MLREKYRLKALENGVLRKTFEPNRDKVTGEGRRRHKQNLYKFHVHGSVHHQ
jgi:hypothetical protein